MHKNLLEFFVFLKKVIPESLNLQATIKIKMDRLGIIDCDDFGECLSSCGGGIRVCQRTCQYGSWGGPGCPISQRQNSVTCNEQPCPSQFA